MRSLNSRALDGKPLSARATSEAEQEEDERWSTTSCRYRGIIVGLVVIGTASPLLGIPAVAIVITCQVVNGCLLPFLSFCLLICANDAEMMKGHMQSTFANIRLVLATAFTMFLAMNVVTSNLLGTWLGSKEHPAILVVSCVATVVGMVGVLLRLRWDQMYQLQDRRTRGIRSRLQLSALLPRDRSSGALVRGSDSFNDIAML